ncbi:ATP synthase j chain-domain-containing protein [Mycena rebaudengoi]|nr:ATP synthase j chain-domain-containing protein [Mycena rebaudengoi]
MRVLRCSQVVKPLWPFMAAAVISLYGVSKLQDAAVRSPAYAKDPKNPYAAQIAEEERAKLGGH